jgi:uncharacterized repeat protein (TIGR02543 family)
MKRFKKLTFGVLLLLMSLFFLKTHLFAGETITLTYVSYDTTKLHESDMPLFNPIFDGDDSVPFSTTESVVEEHRKGVEVFHIPNATAQHYSFNGWVYYDNGNEYILRRNDRFFKNTVFYARWTATPKFVTYDLSGGVNNLGNTYLFNVRSTIELQPAYRAGHTFVDWVYYDEEAGADKVITHYENGSWWNKKVSPAVKVAESSPYDINIRATWAVNDYTISFDSNGGSAVASITASYGTTISAPTNPTREGYLFGGWYTSLSYDEEFTFTTMPAKDMTLYAKWDIEAYSIIYMSDGSTYYTLTQDYNTPILAPADPNKIGYTFGGWYTDAGCTTGNEFTLPAKMPAYDTTVYAKWTINKYDVSFSSDGAIVSTVNQNYGTTVTAPTISKTGYLLDGWYKEATHENKWNFATDTVPAKNTTLYAKWILCEYDVEFYDYESVLIKFDKVNYNNSATPPANDHARVVRSGYTFLGWHKEGETDLVDFSTFVVTEAVSFYPSYSLITYNITYDLGGATGTNPNPSTYNVETPTITLSTTGLTKTGYAFNNFKNAANDVITTIPKGSIGHMTIYLNWTLLSYTVSYVTDAPTSIDSHSQDYDTLITEPTISKVGYTLDGWYSDSSMSTLWVFASSKMPAANLTLYAKWTANTTTKYKVEHYFQRASDLTYVLYQTDTKTGTTDTNAVAVNLDHEGYTFNSTHADNLLKANINGDGSTVLKVHYTINQYSVTFFNEMVPIGSAQSVYYNEDATPPATDPTKTGHTFIGWNLDYTNVKADLYIFAQYEINQYNINFLVYGGSYVASFKQNYDTLIVQPADPTKTGCTFGGWYKESGLINEWNFMVDKVPDSDVTLHAKWNTNAYTITFYSNGGSAVANISADYGDAITQPADPTRTGYTFGGWYTDDGTFNDAYVFPVTMPAEDVDLYAKWTVNQYNVIFNVNGGSPTPANQQVDYDDYISKPADPAKTGYTFAGWYSDATCLNEWNFTLSKMPANDVNLYAKWDPASGIKYVVNHYQQNLADDLYTKVAADSGEQTGTTGEVITITPKSYTGFNYNSGASTATGVVQPDGSLVLELYYDRNIYEVTFNGNNGSPAEQKYNVKHGGTVTPTTPTRTHYTFDGWDKSYATITSALIVNAKWKADDFTITYNDTYGLANTNPATYTIETPTITLTNLADRTTHTFKGWYTAASGGTKVTQIVKGSTGNIVLYAQWTVITYTVTFVDDNGTTVLKTETVNHGANATAPADPTRTGYTFSGWDTVFTNVTSDLTVKATYTINQYTITYDTDGGSTISPATLNYGAAITPPADPTKSGYVFAGWNPSIPETMPVGGITVVAQWTNDTFTLTFVTNNSSTVANITQEYNSAITLPTPAAETGYTFGGWYRDNGTFANQFTQTTMPAENVTLYGKWNLINYTITYHNLNGQTHTNPATYTVIYSGNLVDLPHTTTEISLGWYTAASGGTRVQTISAGTTGNLNLYAQWQTRTFTVSFSSNGGSAVEPITQPYGALITKPTNPTRTGYTFVAWYKEGGLTNEWNFSVDTVPAENITLYAKWKINQYTITFQSNGGTTVSAITKNYNEAVTKPADPTMIGHSFDDWYTDNTTFNNKYTFGTMPAQNITLYAKWNINQYTITFQSNGGTTVSAITKNYNEAVTKPADPTKTGHTFDDWYSDAELNNVYIFTTMPAEDITLYAKWNVNQYTISFNSNGGSAVEPITQPYGALITEPTNPTRTGYTFVAWYKEGGLTNEWNFSVDTVPAENITLYAKWNVNQYTISFNSNGGSAVEPITQPYGALITEPTNPTRTGYTFVAWYKEGGLTNEWNFSVDTVPAENITLYAKWNVNQYTITFNSNGGSAVAPITKPYGATVYGPPTPPTLTGYDFDGWYTDNTTFNDKYTFPGTMSSHDLTLYAKWNVKTYSVIFYRYNGGDVLSTQTIAYGDAAIAPPTPTRDGYTWNNWNTAFNNITGPLKVYGQWNIITYVITFVNGGDPTYTKTELMNAFLDDFYDYLGLTSSISDFKHGVGKTSGFDGTWYHTYRTRIYMGLRPTETDENYFVSSEKYMDKWLPFFDMMEKFVREVNATQFFWDNRGLPVIAVSTGLLRLWQWGTNVKPASFVSDATMAMMPFNMIISNKSYNVTTSVTLPTPVKSGFTFTGWYTDPNYTGYKVTSISVGSTGDKKYYAKWKGKHGDRDVMLTEWLTDFYYYINPMGGTYGTSLNDFMHGWGKTSGFDGLWHSEHKAKIYAGPKPTTVNNAYFASAYLYMKKWEPFFDMMDEIIKKINSTQFFWGAGTYTGLIRIKEFATKDPNRQPYYDWVATWP